MSNDSRVMREWASRPADQRYLSLQELHDAVVARSSMSRVRNVKHLEIKAYGTEDNEVIVNTELGPKFFTHWSFNQLSNIAGAPSGYLRKLSGPLAAACINEGLLKTDRDESQVMVAGDETRCFTGVNYGRIWDHEVTGAVMKVNEASGGLWKVPASSRATGNPKRATTLYASDRDVFIFLVDDQHPIEIDGKNLFRGFYTWNSEVGSQVFGLATFLYEFVCDNRLIWGVSHKTELRIRHNSGAPERFITEGQRELVDYSQQSTTPIVEQIKRAQNIKLGKDEDEVKEFLTKRGLTLASAKSVLETAKMESYDPTMAWSLTQAITANARRIEHTDARVMMERSAGKILDSVLG